MEETLIYRRRQYTRLAAAVPMYYGWMLVVVVVLLGVGIEPEELVEIGRFLLIPLAIVTVLFLAFRSLMVSVTPTHVEVAYFFGWPRRRIERTDIVSVEPFRIPWWYGIGIRATPKGWMWSVWGRSTVLLTLANGKRFLIGTDDPDGLAAALA